MQAWRRRRPAKAGLVMIGNGEIPKKAIIKFRKAIPVVSSTPNGSTHVNVVFTTLTPNSLGDPGGASAVGAYPKVAALALWYDNAYVFKVAVSCAVVVEQDDPCYVFSYWSSSITAREATTEQYEKLKDIPRIQFKRCRRAGASDMSAVTRIYRTLNIKDMFPDWGFSKADNVGVITSGPTNTVFFHHGVISMKGTVLDAHSVTSQVTMYAKAAIFRRTEIPNPVS